MELIISICAAGIALYAVITQRQELSAQKEELHKSANALNMQTNLQVLASLLDAEIHLHNFNNKQQLDGGNQKKYAATNFKEIQRLKTEIKGVLKMDVS